MREQPALSVEDWALVVELLDRERQELPTEIHHASLSGYRDQLRERLAKVTRLLDSLHEAAGTETPRNG